MAYYEVPHTELDKFTSNAPTEDETKDCVDYCSTTVVVSTSPVTEGEAEDVKIVARTVQSVGESGTVEPREAEGVLTRFTRWISTSVSKAVVVQYGARLGLLVLLIIISERIVTLVGGSTETTTEVRSSLLKELALSLQEVGSRGVAVPTSRAP